MPAERHGKIGGGPAARSPGWGAAALIALTCLAYLPALHAGFVWDDDTMLTANPLIRAHGGLFRFWFTSQPADYWPVTYSSLWLEWRLWGLNPMGYHATNVLLHLASVLLFWKILRRLETPGAFLAAALFAVHPVNVESVAWIAQRKNLLGMVFYLLSIYWWLRWIEVGTGGPPVRSVGPCETISGASGRAGRPSLPWYCLSLLAFLLAMLSKGSVAFLPVVLAGLIVWRRKLLARDWLRLAPFAAVAAGLTGVNLWFQHHGSAEIIRVATPTERILGAGAAIWFYLGKALLPAHLAFYYPMWRIAADDWRWWMPLAAAVGVTGLMVGRIILNPPGISTTADGANGALGITRPTSFAWAYFCLALVPVMGLTDVYFMRFSLVADHYEHLALLGVAALAGAGWAGWRDWAVRRSPGRGGAVPLAAAVAVVAACVALTWRQIRIYRDLPTFYAAALRANPDSWLAHNNWGAWLLDHGDLAGAQGHLEQALRLNPDYPEADYNLAVVLEREGHATDAIARYEAALRLKPNYPDALNNLGDALSDAGRFADAAAQYEAAIRLRPGAADYHRDLALVLAKLGRTGEAEREYREVVGLSPASAEARLDLAGSEAAERDWSAAVEDDAAAIWLRPGYFEAYNARGIALARLGRTEEALTSLQTALQLNPGFAQAHNNAALILSREGKWTEAIDHFRAALATQPDYWEAHYGLGLALQATGRPKEAAGEFEAARKARGATAKEGSP